MRGVRIRVLTVKAQCYRFGALVIANTVPIRFSGRCNDYSARK